MHVKLFFTILFMLLFKLNGNSQDKKILSTPEGWTVEKFLLPPSFAPELPFKGAEDIRFSPDWNKKKTDGYWTYCFLWTLQGNPTINKNQLEDYLRKYYAGLIRVNLTEAKIDSSIATSANLKLQYGTNKQTYEGRLMMLDYMTQNSITLNIRIQVKAGGNLFFELSAMPYTHPIWQTMDGIGNSVN